MDTSSDLDREKALFLSASAAHSWWQREVDEESNGEKVLAQVMQAAAWVSRYRRHWSLEPMNIPGMIQAMRQPIAEWLPGEEDFVLLDEDGPTPLCLEYVDAFLFSSLKDVEQSIIPIVMDNISMYPDAAERYTQFRRFLVENAFASKYEAASAAREVNVQLSQVYASIPAGAKVQQEGQEVFFPCPRCRWPMTRQGRFIACARSGSCLQAGAKFALDGGTLLAIGQALPPDSTPCTGYAAVLPGIWRYTVLPGLEELDLEKKLRVLSGVHVILWPYIDAYDLDVCTDKRRWRVDVKDYASPVRLAQHLIERSADDESAQDETWIVVPDKKKNQIPILKQHVPQSANYRFASARDFVRLVKEAKTGEKA